MAAGIGNKVEVVDLSAIKAKVDSVFGSGSNDYGYGQVITTSVPTTNSIISANDLVLLRSDMVKIRQHQTGIPVTARSIYDPAHIQGQDLYIPTTNDLVSEGNRLQYDNFADIIIANRFNIAGTENYSSAILTERTLGAAYNVVWNSSITHIATVSAPNVNDGASANFRYFFNTGGSIQINQSIDLAYNGIPNTVLDPNTGSQIPANDKSIGWQQFLASFGTITMNYTNTTDASGIHSNIGFYDLTTVDQVIYQKVNFSYNGVSYLGNSYTISARTDSPRSTIIFTIVFDDAYTGGTDINVQGKLTTSLTQVYASGINVSVLPLSLVDTVFNGGDAVPQYSIAVDYTTVQKGQTATFTITTQAVPDGTIYYWETVYTNPQFSADVILNHDTITISNLTSGNIVANRFINGPIVNEGVYIASNIAGVGNGSSWLLSRPQSYSLTSTNQITTVSFTSTGSTISSNILTIGTITSGTVAIGQRITGTSITAGTYIIGGSGNTWILNKSYTNLSARSISSTPTTRFISTNHKIDNNPYTGSSITVGRLWAAVAVSVGDQLIAGTTTTNRIYKVLSAGTTSATAPTSTTFNTTITSGTATVTYVGTLDIDQTLVGSDIVSGTYVTAVNTYVDIDSITKFSITLSKTQPITTTITSAPRFTDGLYNGQVTITTGNASIAKTITTDNFNFPSENFGIRLFSDSARVTPIGVPSPIVRIITDTGFYQVPVVTATASSTFIGTGTAITGSITVPAQSYLSGFGLSDDIYTATRSVDGTPYLVNNGHFRGYYSGLLSYNPDSYNISAPFALAPITQAPAATTVYSIMVPDNCVLTGLTHYGRYYQNGANGTTSFPNQGTVTATVSYLQDSSNVTIATNRIVHSDLQTTQIFVDENTNAWIDKLINDPYFPTGRTIRGITLTIYTYAWYTSITMDITTGITKIQGV